MAIAQRLPIWLSPDHLTILGVLSALGVGTGYALSGLSPHWLWLASVALVVNWFGDSLDGTIARVRQTERPRYGYYLDHAVDAFTTAVIGVGIGLSPYLPMVIGLLLVVLYLMMSVNVYLESAAFDEFRMDYGWIGPTEVRAILVLANTLLVALHTLGGLQPAGIQPVVTIGASVGIAGMSLLLVVRFATNLRRLARLEPPAGGRQATTPSSAGAEGAASGESAGGRNTHRATGPADAGAAITR